MIKKISRREFLETAVLVGAGAVVAANLNCVGGEVKNPFDNYSELTKKWDPIFGPPVPHGKYYHGRHDFKGHKNGGVANPGVDYDVPSGTPLVPNTNALLYKVNSSERGGLQVIVRHQADLRYSSIYAHLSKSYVNKKNSQGRLIKRNEIFSLSGASGSAGAPHLHHGLYFKGKKNPIDPEKYGIDGGKPVFWDCETELDMPSYQRVYELEKVIKNLEKGLQLWSKGNHDLGELKGNILELSKHLKDSSWGGILDSKHFHDMRDLLKRRIISELVVDKKGNG